MYYIFYWHKDSRCRILQQYVRMQQSMVQLNSINVLSIRTNSNDLSPIGSMILASRDSDLSKLTVFIQVALNNISYHTGADTARAVYDAGGDVQYCMCWFTLLVL